MSIDLLGPHFDIHTGGIDHRELHHVNEIAQSEAYLGDGEWVHYWLHNEFVNVRQAKIAKSAGGGLRLVSLIEEGYEPAAYRLWLAHLAVAVPEMLAERERARAARDWVSADRVRDELDRIGIRIKDTPQGTTWELV